MLIERKLIVGTEERPLMTLEQHSCNLPKKELYNAKHELIQYIKTNNNNSLTWGYFPELKDENKYPKCKILNEKINEQVLSKIDEKFSLAFIRLATGKPISKYGGLHTDVDIGVGHDRTTPYEIKRTLINLGGSPRIIKYTETERDVIKKWGVDIPWNNYKILDIEKIIKIKKLEIPPINESSIWILRFYSSILPHAGITNESGHFIAAYGSYEYK